MVEQLIKNKKVEDLLIRNNVAMLGLFGSYSRGEETENSDLDFLIKFSKRTSLLAHIRLQRQLSEILGREVDLITNNSISPYLREKIMNEVKVIYNAEG
ncbi:nucleotidyltransferase family protein [candidate division KSB1 bacterium]|nr:nucleotidyltransferase family protein [candidate division KSB1 bacterium]MBL7095706.1 nucleotidyltransferase family protein [candidate division KSB1 bacterium]